MRGIVSFDMDMTLLDHKDFKIPESAIEAVKRLRKNYYIVIATGRDMDNRYSLGLAEPRLQLEKPCSMNIGWTENW